MSEYLLPKLSDYDYKLLIACLLDGGDGENENDLVELLDKITLETRRQHGL